MERILIIHRGSLGDFLLFLPSLAALRNRYPDARIEMLGRPEILNLVCPGIVDATGSVERASLVRFFENIGDLPEGEAHYLSSFHTVLALISDPDNRLEHNLKRLGIKRCIVRPPFPAEGEHTPVSSYLVETVSPLIGQYSNSAHITESACMLRFENDELRQAEIILEPDRSAGKRVVALHPGSGSARKCWPAENFTRLLRWLVNRGVAPLVILGPADERLVEEMTTPCSELECALAHNLPLRHIAAMLTHCAAYIGNDSGVTHLAAAAGIPTIAIFGPTDETVWAPPGSHVKIITCAIECRPCSGAQMQRCAEQKCLRGVTLENIVSALPAESVN